MEPAKNAVIPLARKVLQREKGSLKKWISKKKKNLLTEYARNAWRARNLNDMSSKRSEMHT